ncbi:helix-turn-helix domain-containing protein, partial [Pseudomonas cannabina]|uniref:helix-turn-helix domain-containing protein n=1 Tax=Pseudomonas cannabina TaxID=86840 RepID=UPI00088F7075
DALEDSPAEAENMRIRTSLMTAIRDFIEVRQLSQADAAQLFNVTQPRISELQRGKIDLFSVDRLINMLARAACTLRSVSNCSLIKVTCGCDSCSFDFFQPSLLL